MWIYFNEKGNLSTCIAHGEPIRQGNQFDLYVCFPNEERFKHLSVFSQFEIGNRFIQAGARDDSLAGDSVIFQKAHANEACFDFVPGQRYACYHIIVPNIVTMGYGPLGMIVSVYSAEGGWSVLGKSTINVAKTYGESNPTTINLNEYKALMDEFGGALDKVNAHTDDVAEELKAKFFTSGDAVDLIKKNMTKITDIRKTGSEESEEEGEATKTDYYTIFVNNDDGTAPSNYEFGVRQGINGKGYSFSLGTVTSGEGMSVTNSGTDSNVVLDFVLQKGDTGRPGSGSLSIIRKADYAYATKENAANEIRQARGIELNDPISDGDSVMFESVLTFSESEGTSYYTVRKRFTYDHSYPDNDGWVVDTVMPKEFPDNAGTPNIPIYIEKGNIKSGKKYAGGTSLTINGVSKAEKTYSIYAPTDLTKNPAGNQYIICSSNSENVLTESIFDKVFVKDGKIYSGGKQASCVSTIEKNANGAKMLSFDYSKFSISGKTYSKTTIEIASSEEGFDLSKIQSISANVSAAMFYAQYEGGTSGSSPKSQYAHVFNQNLVSSSLPLASGSAVQFQWNAKLVSKKKLTGVSPSATEMNTGEANPQIEYQGGAMFDLSIVFEITLSADKKKMYLSVGRIPAISITQQNDEGSNYVRNFFDVTKPFLYKSRETTSFQISLYDMYGISYISAYGIRVSYKD